MFKIGDWIIDKDLLQIGYITGVEPVEGNDSEYKVIFTYDENRKQKMYKHVWRFQEDIELKPIEQPEEGDLNYLIDLALKTKDFDWLKELTQKENVK